MTTILNSDVTTEAQLDAAIAAANGEAAGAYEIDLGAGAAIALSSALEDLNLSSGVSLDIEADGAVLDGGGTQRGLYVYAGTVTVENLTLENMAATGGAGGALILGDDGATAASVTLTNVGFPGDPATGAAGGDIFVQSGATLVLAPGIGQTETISGVIAGASGQPASGALVLNGMGALVLSAANTFTGGITVTGGDLVLSAAGAAGSGAVTLNGGTLELAVNGAAAAGGVTFAGSPSTPATVLIDASASPGAGQTEPAALTDFGPGDAIDIAGLTYATGATASLVGSTLTVASGGQSANLTLVTPTAVGFSVQNDGAGHALVTTQVASEADLNAAIATADNAAANSGALEIDLGGNIVLSAALNAIDLKAGVTLDIQGGNFVLDGGGAERGLFVYSGVVTIENLTLQNMVAGGGAGASGGGGGAGLGGGLFVADDSAGGAAPGVVTLTNVSFAHDSAVGGAGSNRSHILAGGGGGMGGAGGAGGVTSGGGGGGTGGGGGGGVGVGAAGGGSGSNPGQAGIILGAAAAGAGGSHSPAVGGGGGAAAGGGGGSGNLGPQTNGGGGGGVGGVASSVFRGGAGGFGGGGGGDKYAGGAGGFGGGGGSGYTGGRGGFGGGGGGSGYFGGTAGFGGGAASYLFYTNGVPDGSGGGGLAAGGDIFVQQGASLTIAGGSQLTGGGVTGGAAGPPGLGGSPGSPGQAYGGGIFLQGNQILTFAPAVAQTATVSGVIADMTGSNDASHQTGAGALVLNGAGTLVLTATNTFTGGVTLDQGVLELSAAAAAGPGTISFATGATATLKIDQGLSPGNLVSGFGVGDVIDFAGVGVEAGFTYAAATNAFTASGGSRTVSLAVAPPPAGADFTLTADGHGGTSIGVSMVLAPTALGLVGQPVNGHAAQFTGTGRPGATVTLYADGGTTAVGAGVVAAGGGFTITTTAAFADGSHVLTAVQTTPDGVTGPTATFPFSVAPTTPTILVLVGQSVNGGTMEVKGAGEVGTTVSLYVDGGTAVVGSGVVSAGGTFDIVTTATFADGAHALAAVATDSAGVASAPSASFAVNVDPTAPTVTTLVGQPANGGTIEVQGSGEAGTTVSLYADGGTAVAGSGVVSAGGTFDIVTTATFADGGHILVGVATDPAGLASGSSPSFAVTVDPTAPTITTLVGQPVNGGTIEVQGIAEAGTTVSLYADGGMAVVGSGLVSAGGTFDIVTSGTVADGSHSLVAVAVDSAGLSSAPGGPFTVPVDPTAPTITTLVGQPVNGGTIEVQGIGEAGTTVSLYADGGTAVAGSGLVSAGGTFDIVTTATFVDGAHSLRSVATDSSGLGSASSALFAVPVAPAAPTITTLVGQPVGGSTIEVQGTGEAGTTVSLYADGATSVVGSGVVSAGGAFDIVTSATFSAGAHGLTATAVDAAALTSQPSATFAVTVASNGVVTPILTGFVGQPVSGGTIEVQGVGQAGAVVSLYADGVTLVVGSGVVSANGTFDIVSTATFADGSHSLTATDTVAGLSSVPSGALAVLVDPTAPTITTLVGQPVTGGTIEVQGSGEAGETVSLYADGGTTVVGSGVVSAGGTFDIVTTATFAVGVHALTGRQTDAAGLTSAVGSPFAVTVVPPATPAWKSAVSADWSVAADWTGGIVPNDGSALATMSVAGTYTVGVAAGESFSLGTLTINRPTATLDLAGALTLSGGLALKSGKVVLDNGGVLTGSASLGAGTTLTGYGQIGGAVSDVGAITATGGRLMIGGALTGTGSVTIAVGATLELGAGAAGPFLTFASGGVSTLKLDAPTSVSDKISGFAAGDVIDLAGLTVTSDQYASGVLTLFNGVATLGSLAVSGTYANQVFALSGDGAGGTDIALAAATTPVVATPSTLFAALNVTTPVAGVAIADADAAPAGLTVTATVTATVGLLSAGNAAGGTVTGAGTAKVVIAGSLAQVNADLATLTYVRGVAGTATLTVAATDSTGAAATAASTAVTVGTLAWAGPVSGDWSQGLDWNSGAAPNSAILAPTIAVAGTYTVGVAAGEAYTVKSLTLNNASATLALAGSLTTTTTSVTAGTLQIAGGGMLSGAVTLSPQTRLVGAGLVAGTVSDSGTIEAQGGLLDISGAEAGGKLTIDVGATLELGGAASGAIGFGAGGSSTLKLDSFALVTGAISGFGTGDVIDLTGVTVTSDQYASGVLTLFNGATTLGVLTITGSYAKDSFALSGDGAVGTDLTLAADVATLAAPATLAAVIQTPTPVAGVSLADPTATVAGETFTVTVADSAAVLTASAAGGGTVGGSGTATVTIQGTLAQVNADLATLGYQRSTAGSDKITVSATTSTGTVATPLKISVTTTTAPPPPTITTLVGLPVNGGTIEVQGTGEAGTTVSLYADGGTTVVGSGLVSAAGTFDIVTTVAFADGAHALTAKAMGAAGQPSGSSAAFAVPVVPTAPTITTLVGQPVGMGTIEVRGTGEAGTTVSLYADGATSVVGSGVVSAGGAFDIVTSATFSAGDHSLTATAADAAALTSQPSATFLATVASSGVATPILTGFVGQPVSGGTIEVQGLGQAGAAVRLYADGVTLVVGSGVVSANGTFDIVSTATFADGSHSLTATDTVAGLSSVPSGALAVLVDPTAPTITTLVGQPVTGGTIEVQGSGEAGETVSLYADGGTTVVGSGVVSAGGTFDIVTTATFAVGVHALTGRQTDAAGLTSAVGSPFAVTVVPPATPAWKSAVSADWSVAADWTGGIVPNDGSALATMSVAGTYTVGVAAGESFSLGTLTINRSTATLDLAGALTLSGGLALKSGKVVLDNGGVLTGSASLGAGTTLTGYGQIGGAVSDVGAITATGGRLMIGGALTGTGSVTIVAGATLELGAGAAGPFLTFASGGVSTLKLDAPTSVSDKISGFAAGDVIDLAGLTVTSDQYASGVLTLFNGVATLGSLAVSGTYANQVFALSGDGAGGTDIALAAATTPVVATPSTLFAALNVTTPVAGVAIADADAAPAGLTVTATVTATVGLLSAGNAAGGTVTGAGTAKVVIAGSLAQVNADLATLTYVRGVAGTATLTVAATDSTGAAATAASTAVTVGTLAWAGPVSGDWSQGLDWNSGAAPNSAILAPTIAVAGTYTVGVAAGEAYTVKSLTLNNASATLALAGSLTTTTTSVTAGTLQIAGGGMLSGAVTLSPQTRLVGAGLVAGTVSDSGTIEAQGGLLDISGAEAGGKLTIDVGATLELGGAASGAIGFGAGGSSTLKLDSFALVTGAISGFGTGDVIDLTGVTVTSDQYASGVLTLFNGATTLGVLTITGSYAKDSFALSGDGAVGTDLTLAADVATLAAPATLAAVIQTPTPVAGVSLADPTATAANETFTVTVADSAAVLTASAAGGGTVGGSGTATVTIQGTLAQVNADLATLGYQRSTQGSDQITIGATTSSGATATPLKISVTTTTAPLPPTITTLVGLPVNGGTIEVQGTGEAGTTVSLYADGGTTVVGSGLVSAAGTFDIVTTVAFADGAHALTAKAMGAAGQPSGSSAAFAVPVVPTAPTITTLVGQPANGGTIEVRGTGEAGATVSLYADGGAAVVGLGVVSAGGTFDIVTGTSFAEGTHSLVATATDAVGLRSAPGAAFAVPVAPPPPAITTLVGQPVNGGTIEVQGSGEAGATVRLYADGGTAVVGSGVVSAGGTFDIVTTATFADGSHALAATMTDVAGLRSVRSGALTVLVDPTAPTITTLVGQPVSGGTIEVQGSGEAGETVSLYADGGTTAVGSGVVSAGGTFDIVTTATFAVGVHALTGRQTDAAGLTSAVGSPFAVTVVPPATPAWKSAVSADWSVAADWTGGIVPNDGSALATMSVAGTYTVGVAAGESFSLGTLTINRPTATLDLAGALTLSGGLALKSGKVVLDNGGVLTGSASLGAGTTLTGYGQIGGAVSDVGAITATGGRLMIGGALTGTGSVTIAVGATLELGAGAAGPVLAFASGGVSTLKLDAPTSVSDKISGFAAGDVIDLAGLTVTSDQYASGVLTLFNGATTLGVLTIAGSYAKDIFALSGDGAGGTAVTLAADVATVAAPATLAAVIQTPTPVAGVSLADPTATVANETFTVTVADGAAVLTASAAGGGTVGGSGTATVTIQGTLAQVNADLATLGYQRSTAGSDKITVSATTSSGATATPLKISVTTTNTPHGANPTLLSQAMAAMTTSPAPALASAPVSFSPTNPTLLAPHG